MFLCQQLASGADHRTAQTLLVNISDVGTHICRPRLTWLASFAPGRGCYSLLAPQGCTIQHRAIMGHMHADNVRAWERGSQNVSSCWLEGKAGS